MYIYAERQIYKASGQFKARLMFREDVTSSSRHLITSSFGSQKGYRSIVRDKIKALFHRQRKVNEKVERKARDVEIWNIGRKMER
ncbi:predicted protein [Sclerotinia sclerotiorum 1980 UF-70]|uniref:Uncharacterized protein n=1 Tax=Sclerotinia sclerotiorum (strain ATCC 18683 / 1980 / Ss-1) TaxID=665079 RepID=A7EDQ3_SCLS1|nr:predicted protein [Sclerotinia sclerotiorum 1980 UF-70]EDO00969.1 predicted protein [Sclerotinia sclerotiorum 1980 UF-70]